MDHVTADSSKTSKNNCQNLLFRQPPGYLTSIRSISGVSLIFPFFLNLWSLTFFGNLQSNCYTYFLVIVVWFPFTCGGENKRKKLFFLKKLKVVGEKLSFEEKIAKNVKFLSRQLFPVIFSSHSFFFLLTIGSNKLLQQTMLIFFRC